MAVATNQGTLRNRQTLDEKTDPHVVPWNQNHEAHEDAACVREQQSRPLLESGKVEDRSKRACNIS